MRTIKLNNEISIIIPHPYKMHINKNNKEISNTYMSIIPEILYNRYIKIEKDFFQVGLFDILEEKEIIEPNFTSITLVNENYFILEKGILIYIYKDNKITAMYNLEEDNVSVKDLLSMN